MDEAKPDIVTLLRVTARAAPPSNAVTRLNDQARDMLVAAADEIERLRTHLMSLAEQGVYIEEPAELTVEDIKRMRRDMALPIVRRPTNKSK